MSKYDEVLEDGAKGKDRLIFMKDGDIVDIKGKGKIQDFINREIGLSYTLFMNSIMFGQGIKDSYKNLILIRKDIRRSI